MSKKLLKLKTVFFDQGLMIRGSESVIEGVSLRRATVIPDQRGRLGEIMRADDPRFEKFGQVYFTSTYPGVVKAWHFHKLQTDNFYVIKGLLKIGLYDERQGSQTKGEVNEIYLGEQHGWMCVRSEEAFILNVVSEMYNYQQPDEYRTDPHDNHIPYDWARKDG